MVSLGTLLAGLALHADHVRASGIGPRHPSRALLRGEEIGERAWNELLKVVILDNDLLDTYPAHHDTLRTPVAKGGGNAGPAVI